MRSKIISTLIGIMTFTMTAASASDISVSNPSVDGNVISYTVSCDNSDIIANTSLFCGNKLIGVNIGTGSKVFFAPSNADCVIKVYPISKSKRALAQDGETVSVHTQGSGNIETLIIYPKGNESLQSTAEQIRSVMGGDLAQTVPSFPMNVELYDTVFIGYTQKNGKIDSDTQRIFDKYNFKNTTIVPFCDGDVGGTDRQISIMEPDALIQNSFNAHGKTKYNVEEWLNEIGY